MLNTAAKCPPVNNSQLLDGVTVPPSRYVGPYTASDRVDYYDGSSSTVGVVTAVCDPPGAALAPVNRTLRCLFDYNDDTYRLLGDSLVCAGACVTVECT